MPTQKLTTEIITAAIEGFEGQKRKIDEQIGELRAMLSGGHVAPAASESAPGRRKKFSAEARKKMAMAQKARWAKVKGGSESVSAEAKKLPKKRTMSAAGRKAISDATKKRWALQKAGGAVKPARRRKPLPESAS